MILSTQFVRLHIGRIINQYIHQVKWNKEFDSGLLCAKMHEWLRNYAIRDFEIWLVWNDNTERVRDNFLGYFRKADSFLYSICYYGFNVP